MSKKKESIPSILTVFMDEKEHINNINYFLKALIEEDILLLFDNNKIIIGADEDNNNYIYLFTDENQIKDINIDYDRIDKTKIDIVIRDIFNKGNYEGIVLNPFTHDFYINRKLTEIIMKIINGDYLKKKDD